MARSADDRSGYDLDQNRSTTTRQQSVSTGGSDVDGNGTAIAAFIVGMIAVTLGFLAIPFLAAILLGLAAIILGAMGLGKANRFGGLHKGLAMSGLITGVLGLLLGIAVPLGLTALADRARDEFNSNPALQNAASEAEEAISEATESG
jgi:hypothetical protein